MPDGRARGGTWTGYAVSSLAVGVPLIARGIPGLRADGPPLDPSSPQARDWLAEELTKSKYHTAPSLWDRFMDWLRHLLGVGDGAGGGLPAWGTYVVIAVLLVIVGAVLLRVVRREARTRSGAGGAVLDEAGLSAEEYLARGVAAAGRSDWDGAVLDGYRAIAQGVVERAILDDLPGRTADEVAAELGPVFPDAAEALRHAAVAFDAVRYGHLAATEETARAVLAVEDRIRRARPILPDLADLADLAMVEP